MWASRCSHGVLVPLVLIVCLVLLGVMLAIWRMIKGPFGSLAYG